MKPIRKLCLSLVLFLVCTSSRAQLEVAHLSTDNFSAVGFGTFLNFHLPVNEGSAISLEAGFYYFKDQDHNFAIVPFLLGYRYFFDGSQSGLYVEPSLGYTIGASDIQKSDENGNPLYNPDGSTLDQKAKGPSAAIGAGYTLKGNIPLNFGVRYHRVFVSGDPSLNIFSFRISYPFSLGRRNDF